MNSFFTFFTPLTLIFLKNNKSLEHLKVLLRIFFVLGIFENFVVDFKICKCIAILQRRLSQIAAKRDAKNGEEVDEFDNKIVGIAFNVIKRRLDEWDDVR